MPRGQISGKRPTRAIENLFCYQCKTPIGDLRSFKCHNWAYARQELLEVVERVNARVTE